MEYFKPDFPPYTYDVIRFRLLKYEAADGDDIYGSWHMITNG